MTTTRFTKEQLTKRIEKQIDINSTIIKRLGDDSAAVSELAVKTAMMDMEIFNIALASLEAEAVAWLYSASFERGHVEGELTDAPGCDMPVYTAPPVPVSVHEDAPVAYIFKHPAGRLFWSLTDESNKGQSDVMPVYSAPVPAFVPPAIEPDYEVIKGILPTANPDEYACCIAADMWNACRAAMLQGADGNSPVIPDCWVACSERMPEEGSKVIVFRPRASESNDPPVKTATYKGGREYYHGFDCYCEPTHWMPLPAAPQQEAE